MSQTVAMRGVVVRLFTPAGALFPKQQYLTAADEWSDDSKDASVFSYEEADRLARHLAEKEGGRIYPMTRAAQARPDASARREPAHDWHEGKPNCGVE